MSVWRKLFRGRPRLVSCALALIFSQFAIVGCMPSERTEANAAAAPIRQALNVKNAKWNAPLCVGYFSHDGSVDFPSGVLDDVYVTIPAIRPRSTCLKGMGPFEHVVVAHARFMTCGVAEYDPRTKIPTKDFCEFEHLTWDFPLKINSAGEFVAGTGKVIGVQ
ncbi:MAG: hypothetical protein HY243_03080 [Proteobacteria bacterium]|nr:hypothetical protein [Pseudomonadota bacterium]